jgi:transcription-repair coupling factor (superfamily II helicase)
MYTTMLEEAVSRLKGEGREERPQVTVNLGVSLRIDESYIPEEGQRLRMYKRIAGAESEAVLTEVRAELEDRYGKPPESVLHLLAAGEIRLTCERLGIAQLERKRTAVESPAAPKKAAPAPAAPRRDVAHAGYRPLPGRFGQAPVAANLQYSSRAALNRPVSNATRAVRETVGQAGRIGAMREMLYVTFSEKLHAAPVEGAAGVNVGLLMKLVARSAKSGAQLTPQGVLKWPLSGASAEVVLRETRELLAMLDGAGG